MILADYYVFIFAISWMRWKKVDENPNINKLMAIIYAETDREID